ncbi:unnamed protein product [Calypogeia fissa]
MALLQRMHLGKKC